ncbi:MAG: hypothetical protein ACO2O2_09760 [Acidilobaceae archaeon]
MLRPALLLTILISPLLGVLIASGGNPVVTIAVDLYHAPTLTASTRSLKAVLAVGGSL